MPVWHPLAKDPLATDSWLLSARGQAGPRGLLGPCSSTRVEGLSGQDMFCEGRGDGSLLSLLFPCVLGDTPTHSGWAETIKCYLGRLWGLGGAGHLRLWFSVRGQPDMPEPPPIRVGGLV